MLNIEGHELTTHSRGRGDLTTHSAECSCGASYEWYSREIAHQAHVLEMVAAKPLGDLLDRCRRAVKALAETHEGFSDEQERRRIDGKIEGVYLVCSYIEEALR